MNKQQLEAMCDAAARIMEKNHLGNFNIAHLGLGRAGFEIETKKVGKYEIDALRELAIENDCDYEFRNDGIKGQFIILSFTSKHNDGLLEK